MTLDVPEPVAKYLAAEEAKDADAFSRCFTEDGTVHDENSGLFWGFWGLSEGSWDQYWDQVSGPRNASVSPSACQHEQSNRPSDLDLPALRFNCIVLLFGDEVCVAI
jgi:hypothetical protein